MKILNRIQKFFHDNLGQGFVEKRVGGDNFQPTYKCKFCDNVLAQDSQGNYFHLYDRRKIK